MRKKMAAKGNSPVFTAEEVHALQGVPPAQRQAIIDRIAQRHQRYGLKQGENQAPLPPDPPPNWGRFREAGKGGAISPDLREIGVDVTTPDVVERPAPVEEVQVEARQAKMTKRPPTPKRNPAPSKAIALRPPPVPLFDDVPEKVTIIKLPDWSEVDVQEGQQVIAYVRKLLEEGGQIISQRLGIQVEQQGFRCAECGNPIARAEAAVMIRPYRDEATGMLLNRMWCSNRCYLTTEAHGAPRRSVPGASLTTRDTINADGTVRTS